MVNISRLAKIDNKTSSIKVVKRKYTTKKHGTVTKEYTYSQSTLLFKKTKTGYKLQKEEWERFEKAIRNEYGDSAEGTSLINEARKIRKDILNSKDTGVGKYGGKKQYYGGNLNKSGYSESWNRIDVKSMISRLAQDSTSKFLANMGLTPDDVIQYVSEKTGKVIKTADLLDPGKWEGDIYHADGFDVVIEFNYDGINHIKIQPQLK